MWQGTTCKGLKQEALITLGTSQERTIVNACLKNKGRGADLQHMISGTDGAGQSPKLLGKIKLLKYHETANFCFTYISTVAIQ